MVEKFVNSNNSLEKKEKIDVRLEIADENDWKDYKKIRLEALELVVALSRYKELKEFLVEDNDRIFVWRKIIATPFELQSVLTVWAHLVIDVLILSSTEFFFVCAFYAIRRRWVQEMNIPSIKLEEFSIFTTIVDGVSHLEITYFL